jgi:restriction system protein
MPTDGRICLKADFPMDAKPLSPSSALAAKLMHAGLTWLHEQGGAARGAQVMEALPRLVELDEWAQATIQSNGLSRWETYASFFSVDAVKAGYLVKSRGDWRITPEGVAALEGGLPHLAQEAARAVRSKQC